MAGDSSGFTGQKSSIEKCKAAGRDDHHGFNMIEALAIVFVAAVSLGVYIMAWVGAREASGKDLSAELAELRLHRETLVEKTVRGQREQWDQVMTSQLAHRIDWLDRQIAQKASQA